MVHRQRGFDRGPPAPSIGGVSSAPTPCQLCRSRPASLHLTAVGADGVRQEVHACPVCLQQAGVDPAAGPPPVTALLARAADAEPAPAAGTESAADDPVCPECGISFSAYASNNLLGCPICYDALGERLAGLMRRYHGASRHRGRLPADTAVEMPAPAADERARLEAELRTAVASERYEAAAELRDRLKKLG